MKKHPLILFLLILLFLFNSTVSYSQSKSYIPLKKYQSAEFLNYDSASKYCRGLCNYYFIQNNDSSLKYGKLAVFFADKSENIITQGLAYEVYCRPLAELSRIDEALNSLRISEEKLIKAKDYKGLAGTYNSFGVVYMRLSNPIKSTEYFLKGIHNNELCGEYAAIAYPKMNIIANYLNLSEFEKVKELALQILTDTTFKNDKVITGRAIHYLGQSYVKNNPTLAIYYFNKSLAYYNFKDENLVARNSTQLSIIFLSLAECYLFKYDKSNSVTDLYQAKKWALKSEDICLKHGVEYYLPATYNILSQVETFSKNYDRSIALAYKGVKLCEKYQTNFHDVVAFYNSLNLAYAKKGNYDSAYHYLKIMNTMQDSVKTDEIKKKMLNQESDYALEKKDAENAYSILQKDKDITMRNLIITIVSFGGIVIILIILFYAQRIKKQKQKEFSLQLIRSQEEERLRLSRDLHDSVGQSLLFLKMQSDNKYLNLIEPIIEEVRTISRNLRPIKMEIMSLQQLIINLVETAKAGSSIFFTYEIADVFITDINIKINIYRIIQESLSNIIKHSEAKNARVNLIKDGHKLKITIFDDGKGFDFNEIKNKQSIGLISLKERANLIGGEFKIVTGLNGTKIELQVKYE